MTRRVSHVFPVAWSLYVSVLPMVTQTHEMLLSCVNCRPYPHLTSSPSDHTCKQAKEQLTTRRDTKQTKNDR